MIKSKKELDNCLDIERQLYFNGKRSLLYVLKCKLLNNHDYQIWKFQKALRKLEYHLNNNNKIGIWFWQSIKNNEERKLGFSIPVNVFDVGLRIWHFGSIAVNSYAKVGKNCQLHGSNCIGNKGDSRLEAPVIGDNVDVGFGAVVIGNVIIAENCRIGANAVVVKSCLEKNTILVGNPATTVEERKWK